MPKKKILIISPVPTHPQISGNRARVLALSSSIRALGHDVMFLHIELEPGDIKAMHEYWGENYVSCKYSQPEYPLLKFLKKIYRKLGLQAAYRFKLDQWYDSTADFIITELHKKHKFDVAIVEYVFMSRALDNFGSDVIKILDTHDVFTDRHKRYLKQGQKPVWFSTSKKEESCALNRSDYVIAIQKREAEFFARACNKKVVVIGHNIDLHNCDESVVEKNRILLVASTNKINIQAVKYLVNEIMPKVVKKIPTAQLAIAGGICECLPDYKGVLKLGIVPDLTPIYCSATVVVNPVTIGTGLKIKTIEALAYGKPLVTTSTGADGLESNSGESFYVSDKPDEFANFIIKILNSKDIRVGLSKKSLELVSSMNASNIEILSTILEENRNIEKHGLEE